MSQIIPVNEFIGYSDTRLIKFRSDTLLQPADVHRPSFDGFTPGGHLFAVQTLALRVQRATHPTRMKGATLPIERYARTMRYHEGICNAHPDITHDPCG